MVNGCTAINCALHALEFRSVMCLRPPNKPQYSALCRGTCSFTRTNEINIEINIKRKVFGWHPRLNNNLFLCCIMWLATLYAEHYIILIMMWATPAHIHRRAILPHNNNYRMGVCVLPLLPVHGIHVLFTNTHRYYHRNHLPRPPQNTLPSIYI